MVYRCTMVTLKSEGPSGAKPGAPDIKKLGPHIVMDDATAGLITSEEARELIDAVNEQLGSEMIQFFPGAGHRHLMVWVNGKPRAVCVDPGNWWAVRSGLSAGRRWSRHLAETDGGLVDDFARSPGKR